MRVATDFWQNRPDLQLNGKHHLQLRQDLLARQILADKAVPTVIRRSAFTGPLFFLPAPVGPRPPSFPVNPGHTLEAGYYCGMSKIALGTILTLS